MGKTHNVGVRPTMWGYDQQCGGETHNAGGGKTHNEGVRSRMRG